MSAEVISASNYTSTTSMPTSSTGATLTGWNNVGSFVTSGSGASGVYVGNGWVLTAAHAGDGNIDFESAPSGQFYDYNGTTTYQLTNPDGSNADLLLYNVGNTGLPNITFATSTPAAGNQVFSVGYGLIRSSSSMTNVGGSITGYTEAARSPLLRTWGNNTLTTDPYTNTYVTYTYTIGPDTVVGLQTVFGPSGNSASLNSEDTQIAAGDSGGALFNTAGQLIGINEADLNFNGQTADTAAYGNYSVYSYLSAYYVNQIYNITGVPEPTVGMVVLGGIGAMCLRRRKSPAL